MEQAKTDVRHPKYGWQKHPNPKAMESLIVIGAMSLAGLVGFLAYRSLPNA